MAGDIPGTNEVGKVEPGALQPDLGHIRKPADRQLGIERPARDSSVSFIPILDLTSPRPHGWYSKDSSGHINAFKDGSNTYRISADGSWIDSIGNHHDLQVSPTADGKDLKIRVRFIGMRPDSPSTASKVGEGPFQTIQRQRDSSATFKVDTQGNVIEFQDNANPSTRNPGLGHWTRDPRTDGTLWRGDNGKLKRFNVSVFPSGKDISIVPDRNKHNSEAFLITEKLPKGGCFTYNTATEEVLSFSKPGMGSWILNPQTRTWSLADSMDPACQNVQLKVNRMGPDITFSGGGKNDEQWKTQLGELAQKNAPKPGGPEEGTALSDFAPDQSTTAPRTISENNPSEGEVKSGFNNAEAGEWLNTIRVLMKIPGLGKESRIKLFDVAQTIRNRAAEKPETCARLNDRLNILSKDLKTGEPIANEAFVAALIREPL